MALNVIIPFCMMTSTEGSSKDLNCGGVGKEVGCRDSPYLRIMVKILPRSTYTLKKKADRHTVEQIG